MENFDIEIYFSQFKTFFNKNPKELHKLIGEGSPDEFFNEVYNKILENNKKGEDLELTKKQMIDVVIKINQMSNKKDIQSSTSVFTKTKFGEICLN